MMPKPADIPACPALPTRRNTRVEKREYQIELLTPMFGGGVEAGQPDASFPIRGTSIRGQLQFWWRATVGAKYDTKEQLREAQSEIWGSTERASRVVVRVEDVHHKCAVFEEDRKNRHWLPYALFPFQPAKCVRNASFKLIIDSPPDLWPELEPTLWAWANFGGLGARTRRGCGALLCKDFAPKDANDLVSKWKQYMPQSYPVREWPTVAASLLIEWQPKDAIPAWDQVIALMRDFRQGADLGRNPGQKHNRPGRSRWPEPETIRETPGTGADRSKSKHQRLAHIPADAFPRAELGLPIVFHFQGKGDPSDTVLYPDGGQDRMASPLILKPLALGNGKAIPMVLQLQTPPLTGVDLRQGSTSATLPSNTVIRDPRLSSYLNSPLAKSTNGSALEAFLELAKSHGFTEVSR